jgi:hypothetical protein
MENVRARLEKQDGKSIDAAGRATRRVLSTAGGAQ